MTQHTVGIIMNGVTGRMGANQHLGRSIAAIREDGGIPLGDGEVIWPEPLLVGRNEHKLEALSKQHGDLSWTTDLDAALQNDDATIYFDAQTTDRRADAVKAAIDAGKHIYCEKPSATTADVAFDLYQRADLASLKHGVVQDKLFLPGIQKLKYLIDTGFFGEIISVRGEFGYWVFTGEHQPAQRPSWNYKRDEGGGIISDMMPHWRYVIDNLFGRVIQVNCVGATHIPQRWDEQGNAYESDAEDACYATMVTDHGVVCHFNSSWCVRVRRDDLLTVQVDGTHGSAVAGLRDCWVQPDAATPKPVWNPDVENPIDFYGSWQKMPDNQHYPNAFRAQWELFLRHVVNDEPYYWTLREGARGVQLSELAYQSWQNRGWVEVEYI